MGGLIGEIGTLLGGGPNNAQWQAQAPQNVIQPFTAENVNQGLAQGQQGLQAQQDLVNQLGAQGGLANQSNVFNQLQNVASGLGPNPAQAMLQQATGQNVANQAALMASQRGAGANPALLARQAGMAGGNAQQQAAGQGATLQANQSLGALNQLGGLAGQQVANQIGATQGLGQLSQSQQQQMINALQNQNQANIQSQAGMNAANQAMAATNANNAAKATGEFMNTIGGAASKLPKLLGLAEGGEVENPKLARVAPENRFPPPNLPPHMQQAADIYHEHHGFGHKYEHKSFGGGHFEQGGKIPGKAEYSGDNKKNDVVPAMLSKGEIVLPNSVTQSKDPVEASAQFVAALESKKGKGEGKDAHKDFKEALGRAIKGRKKT